MHLHRILVGVAAGVATSALLFGPATQAPAAPFPNTLWVGADPFDSGDVPFLNTTTTGAVLRTTDPFSPVGRGNGIAVDVAGNALYLGRFNAIQKQDLTTLANIGGPFNQNPLGSLAEDMTFDSVSQRIWRTDYGQNRVNRIDPATGNIDFFFNPANFSGPVGIAWDGKDLWVGDFNLSKVEKFTTAGVDTGQGFSVAGQLTNSAGGLGFNPNDNTLFLGSEGPGGQGRVYHYTLTGTQLGFFDTSDHRFVDGLEFEAGPTAAVVPEPSTLALLALGAAAVAGWRRWRRPRT